MAITIYTDNDFASLLARVNALDGANLPSGAQGQIQQLSAQIAGLKQTVNQTMLLLEGEIQQLQQQVASLNQQLNLLRGAR